MKFGLVWTDLFVDRLMRGALYWSASLYFIWPAAKNIKKKVDQGRLGSVHGRSMIVFSRTTIIFSAAVISSGKSLQYEFRKVVGIMG